MRDPSLTNCQKRRECVCRSWSSTIRSQQTRPKQQSLTGAVTEEPGATSWLLAGRKVPAAWTRCCLFEGRAGWCLLGRGPAAPTRHTVPHCTGRKGHTTTTSTTTSPTADPEAAWPPSASSPGWGLARPAGFTCASKSFWCLNISSSIQWDQPYQEVFPKYTRGPADNRENFSEAIRT